MPCPSDWAAASSGGEHEGSADSATSLDSPSLERFDVGVRYFCRPTPGMFLQFLRLPYFIFSFPGRSFIFLKTVFYPFRPSATWLVVPRLFSSMRFARGVRPRAGCFVRHCLQRALICTEQPSSANSPRLLFPLMSRSASGISISRICLHCTHTTW